MARDEHLDPSRRSFFVRALTGVAGGWVALTGAGAVSSLIAACSRKGESGSGGTDRPQPVDKYGGPPVRRDAPPPVAAKYGGPPPPKYGGPPLARATPDAGIRLNPMRARKYGGPMRTPPATKYGGPVRTSKYGGPERRRKPRDRKPTLKVGGPSTTDL